MSRLLVVLALLLVLTPVLNSQDPYNPDDNPPNPEMQRQEIINLERETARAILLNNGTFFRRVYADDFAGTLSHGQTVDKAHLINEVQTAAPVTSRSTLRYSGADISRYRDGYLFVDVARVFPRAGNRDADACNAHLHQWSSRLARNGRAKPRHCRPTRHIRSRNPPPAWLKSSRRCVDPECAGVTLRRTVLLNMRAVDIIRKKRDSGENSREEIEFLDWRLSRAAEIPDYQMAAWLMSAWIRGLSRAETAALTQVMLHSGEVLDLSSCPRKKWTSIPPAEWETRHL